MNNRQRKKWLKKQDLYVNPKETWSLDIIFARYIIPRLKKFKELSNGYPGDEEMDTPEKWDDALDKMIQAFEYVLNYDSFWIGDPKYDYFSLSYEEGREKAIENLRAEDIRRLAVINDGLQLFAKYYMALWW